MGRWLWSSGLTASRSVAVGSGAGGAGGGGTAAVHGCLDMLSLVLRLLVVLSCCCCCCWRVMLRMPLCAYRSLFAPAGGGDESRGCAAPPSLPIRASQGATTTSTRVCRVRKGWDCTTYELSASKIDLERRIPASSRPPPSPQDLTLATVPLSGSAHSTPIPRNPTVYPPPPPATPGSSACPRSPRRKTTMSAGGHQDTRKRGGSPARRRR